ncbi:hypothetical protein C2S53_016226 [Perilla frutescens var. hirtella]|uniref:Calmodulin-binding domain-containing protein n=1 Tax=Perilla frutescens var. hirtella TaxID=608512 RepID=A0AAD4J9N0_PERFH|nr:hypothetical protein C2S53_016226 [Perilla frutescens var. hirtella]
MHACMLRLKDLGGISFDDPRWWRNTVVLPQPSSEKNMDSADAPLSLNSGCTPADDSSKATRQRRRVIPHHLLPSSGSCHDICKYGRRRPFELQHPTKPLHKKTAAKLVIPTRRKREILEDELHVETRKHSHLVKKPSPDAKSFSPTPKTLSLSGTKRTALPEKVMKESNSVGRKITACDQLIDISPPVRLKPVMVKPSPASHTSHGKRRRNEDIPSAANTRPSMLSAKVSAPLSTNRESSKGRKTARVEPLSPRKDQKRVKRVKTDSFQEEDDRGITCSGNEDIECVHHVEENQIKCPRIQTESNENEFEFEFESITGTTPSSLSHGEEDEESDKLVSDTTTVSRRNKNHNSKRRRRSRAARPGDKQCRAVKLKFRIGNSTCQHKENNVPRKQKFRTESRANDAFSDNNESIRMGSLKTSRNRNKHRSKASKNSRGRVRYVKARVLVLEHKKGDSKSDYEKKDDAGAGLLLQKNNLKRQDLQRKRDQCLFNYVIEETASKLAERRKGMVKSLVGAFEALISLQTRALPHDILTREARNCYLNMCA